LEGMVNLMSGREILTRITILVDNNVGPEPGLVAEHGFAALIERARDRILFDTGQGPALIRNAATLGIDLSTLTSVVLSHGHYDHTGGLLHCVYKNPGVTVVAHPKALNLHFKLQKGEGAPKSIGIPHQRELMEHCGARFHLTEDFEEISQGVWFTGYVPRDFSHNKDGRLVIPSADGFQPDMIEDDASLLLDTRSGFVLLLGCAHAGVRNILEYVCRKAGIDRLHAVVGGTHLGFSPQSETYAAIAVLEQFDVRLLAPAHCTGPGPSGLLQAYFQERFRRAQVGSVFEF